MNNYAPWYVNPEWWLVIVGVPTLRFLYLQLREMVRATGAAEKAAEAASRSAKAALLNAQALIKSERAWILVDTGGIPDFEPEPNTLTALELRPIVKNYGKTIGHIQKYCIQIQHVATGHTLPAEPHYLETAMRIVNIPLPPEQPIRPFPVLLSMNTFSGVYQGTSSLYLYGFVQYTDFSGEPHETRFCIVYYVPTGFSAQKRGFYLCLDAPEPYTRCT